jgi:hypothetical protein
MNNRYLSLIIALVLSLNSFATNIETDRQWYLAGEAMKVSITTENAFMAYAELCDMHSLVAGTLIKLNKGKGAISIELPSNLHSGYYVLSVYTRDNANVTNKLVGIVNPLRKNKDDDIKWMQDDSCWVTSVGTSELINNKTIDVCETEGHIIKAHLKNIYGGHTFKDSQITPSLSIIGKQVHYFEGKMINDTTAVFYTSGIHGKQPLVLSALSSTGVSLPIEMINPFETLLPRKLPHLVFHYKRSEVEARSMDMQRHQIAITPVKRELQLGDHADDTAEDVVPLGYDETIFGIKPDLSYNLDEYRQFLTIREVLLEYVVYVSNRTINGVPKLIVRKEDAAYDTSSPTLVLIDGMPVIDTERLLNYDARRIHHINIYSGQYTFGNGVYNGILSFVTRSGRLTNYPTEPNMQYLVYEFPE